MLQMKNAALVVVDIQGKLATLMHEKEAFFENAAKMIQGCQTLDIPVFWNEQLPDKLGRTIEPIQTLFEGREPLIKNSFSCCGNPKFTAELTKSGRKQVMIVGMETHVCVYQTAMDLLGKGYEVYLVADAVSSRSTANKHFGIEAMRDAGAKITTVEMALFEMLGVAEGEAFKKIIKIVK